MRHVSPSFKMLVIFAKNTLVNNLALIELSMSTAIVEMHAMLISMNYENSIAMQR